MNASPLRSGSAGGLILTLVLVLGLVGLGAWLVLRPAPVVPAVSSAPTTPAADAPTSPAATRPSGDQPQPIEPAPGAPRLAQAATFTPKDGVITLDISEYAGYAGLLVANGGLEPNADSFFTKQYGFQVKLINGEDENWSDVNNGKLAGCATTADVLAVMGRQFACTVPVQIGYSRGADMLVVDRGITSINQLAGKVVAAEQFNESEFFIRNLASEAGLKTKVLRDLDARPAADELGLVFYADAFTACNAYAFELAGTRRINGVMGWSPRTDEVVAASKGTAKALVTNRNLLVVADILVLNQGFAQAHPQIVKGLVHGLLEGNRQVRDNPEVALPVLAKVYGWKAEDARAELAKVHLSNLPENLAFFAGTIDAAGSFGGIYQQAVTAYGPAVIPNPPDAERFLDLAHLKALQTEDRFPGATIAISPIRTSTRAALEGDALLSKDIRFFFEPNSATLDAANTANPGYLDTVQRYLQVSPGSVVMLRGHVDDRMKDQFRTEGGEALVKSMALKAVELSRQRAMAVRAALLARHPRLDASRVEAVGRGWDEPASGAGDLNRRVEERWYTVE